MISEASSARHFEEHDDSDYDDDDQDGGEDAHDDADGRGGKHAVVVTLLDVDLQRVWVT